MHGLLAARRWLPSGLACLGVLLAAGCAPQAVPRACSTAASGVRASTPPRPSTSTATPVAAPSRDASPLTQLCARFRSGGEPLRPTAEPGVVDLAEPGRPPLLRRQLWDAQLAGGVRAVAISNEPPTCTTDGGCTAQVLLECPGSRYVNVLGRASSAILPDGAHTDVGAQAWLDLFEVDPNPLTNLERERRTWHFNGTSYQQTVDCPRIDATQQPLGEPAYPLEGLKLAPGKLMPQQPLPNELFRVPLQWPAARGALAAIGFEVPGDAAGLAFVYRGCLLNTWFYSFGGNGVELTLHEALLVGRTSLLLVEAPGWARGYYPDPEHSDDHVDASQQLRWLVFAVDETSARLLVDSDDYAALNDEPVSMSAAAASAWLVVGRGAGARRFRYDAKLRTFSGLSAFARKR